MRFNATANFQGVESRVKALQARVASFNATLAQTSMASGTDIINPQGWNKANNAVNQMSDAYRAAAASSGLLQATQLKARPVVERTTADLQNQKLALKDIITYNGRVKNSIKDVYRDQLRLQRMTVTSRGFDKSGREITDITVPSTVPKSLDTIANKAKFARTAIASASEQMINLGKNTQWTGRQMTVGFTYPMVLFGAATGKLAYDVDKQMTRIAKVYDSTLGNEATTMAKATEITKLRADSYKFAADMAKQYGASAKETLAVEAEFAAQGKSGKELFDTSRETIRIATLGEVDFTQATEMTYALQSAFRSTIKDSEDLTRAFNMMNAIENATALTIQDMAEAVPRAATALAGLGVTVDETAVLMTAMKEAAIPAAEGANALKSLSTRIINPGIWKQAQPFFDGFANLEELSRETGGNIYQFATRLGELTRGMDDFQRNQGMAKLFGAWQFNRGSAIVKNLADGMTNLEDQSTQTARAIATVNKSAEDLAEIADLEIRRKMESMSGRFDSALEQIKISAAKMGEAFLPMATKALNMFNTVFKGIDRIVSAMPNWMQNVAVIGAVFLGVMGPLIMTVGIFKQMAGWLLKVIGIGSKFNIMNRAQMAAEMQAEKTRNAYMAEATAVSVLTDELRALAAAQGYSTGVANAVINDGVLVAGGQNGVKGGVYNDPMNGRKKELPSGHTINKDGPQLPYGWVATTRTTVGASGEERKTQHLLGPTSNKSQKPSAVPNYEAWKRQQKDITSEVAKTAKAVDSVTPEIEDAATASKKIGKNFDTAKVGASLLGITIMSQMIPGAESFSSALMTGATALMAISAGKDMLDMVKGAKEARKASKAAAAAEAAAGVASVTRWSKITEWTKRAAVNVKGVASGMNPRTVGMVGASKTLMGNFGKVAGLAGKVLMRVNPWVAGISAAAVAAGFLWKKLHEGEKRQDAINNSADDWAKLLGGVSKKYDEIKRKKKEVAETSDGKTAKELAEEMVKTDSGEARAKAVKKIRERGDGSGFKGDDSALDSFALNEYFKIVESADMTAADAKVALEAMFLAGGYGADFAAERAQHYYDVLGDKPDLSNYTEMWGKNIEESQSLFGKGFASKVDALAREIGDKLDSSNPFERKELFDGLKDNLSRTIGNAWEEGFLDRKNMSVLQQIGVNSGEELAKALRAYEYAIVDGNGGFSQHGFFGANGIDMDIKDFSGDATELATALEQAYQYGKTGLETEKRIATVLSDQYDTQLGYNNLMQLENQFRADSFSLSEKEAKRDLKGAMAQRAYELGRKLTAEEKLQVLNAERLRLGLKETTKYSDMFRSNTEGTAKFMRQAAAEAAKTSGALAEAKQKVYDTFVSEGWLDVRKEIMGAVQDDVVSQSQDTWAASQEREADRLSAAFDREKDSLDDRKDHWDEFYEKALDKNKEFYDGKIERINKEIKAEEEANNVRQRLFDAEEARLSRIAERENSNIDFNMAINEGRLDEAAKLMNDAAAKTASAQMDDEKAKADGKLEKKKVALEAEIERLELARDRKQETLETDKKAKEKAIELAREKAEKTYEIDKKNLEAKHKLQKKYQDMALAELKAGLPTTEKQMQKSIERINGKYAQYGVQLKAESGNWAEAIAEKHNSELANAARKLKSDVNWAGAGFDAVDGMLDGMAKAMGMDDTDALREWLGLEAAGKRPKGKKKSSTPRKDADGNHIMPGGKSMRHGGGLLGRGGKDSRAGFTGSISPHNEVELLAQKGEYVVKKSSVNKYGSDFLDKINDGTYGIGGPSSGSASSAMQGIFGKIAFKTAQSALSMALNSATSNYGDDSMGLIGDVFAAQAGKYGGGSFDEAQMANAAVIARVGKSMGASQRDITIALMTAMQESMLRNIDYGDRDSLGLFQQRPSMGWGTAAQVTNPTYSSKKFYEGLLAIEGRGKMSLTEAAQAVQRSAFPNAYAKWEDEARAILAAMGGTAGGGLSGGFAQGKGGKHRPVNGGVLTQGLHYSNAVDIGIPVGKPVYSVADGKVIESKDIVGKEGRAAHGGLGYRSYGRYITVDHGGYQTKYAHLSQRAAPVGKEVKGGARIGLSGNTGNSSGPHLHFESHGKTPYAFLRKGGELRWDNTPAILHKGETVLTAPLTKKFKDGVANGDGNSYNVTIDLRGAYVKEDVDVKKAVKVALKEIEMKNGKRRVVN